MRDFGCDARMAIVAAGSRIAISGDRTRGGYRRNARDAAIKAKRPSPAKPDRSPGLVTNSKRPRFAEGIEFRAQRIDGWLGDSIHTRDREDFVKLPLKSRARRRKKGGEGALAVGGQVHGALAKLVQRRGPLGQFRDYGFSGSRIADPL